jgi:hypothetical protein
MTHVISIMEEYFHLREFEYLRLDGQTKQEERADLVKVFLISEMQRINTLIAMEHPRITLFHFCFKYSRWRFRTQPANC